jgi:hypothetical protein
MSLDYLIAGGGVACVAVGLLIYAYKLYGANASARIKAVATSLKPAEAVIVKTVQAGEQTAADLFLALHDELVRNSLKTAATRHTNTISDSMADEQQAKFAAALIPKDQAAPKPPAS